MSNKQTLVPWNRPARGPKTKPRRAAVPGWQFAPFHPDIGHGRLARTWPGLLRSLGRMRSRARFRGYPPTISLHATPDWGRTWRPMTPDELYRYAEAVGSVRKGLKR